MRRTSAFLSLYLLGLLTSASTGQAQQTASPLPLFLPHPLFAVTVQPNLQFQRQGTVNSPNTTGWTQPEMRHIEGDDHRANVLLAPGGRGYIRRRIQQNPDGTIRDFDRMGTGDKNASPGTPSAGLLVVLPSGDGDGKQAAEFWIAVMQNVLKGRYYVALAIAPKWETMQTATWLTEASVKQVKTARFSTEAFAADIARNVASVYNIDPQRTFLHGAAESGLATYACSLTDTTPFKGFYIHDALFRSGQLPSLAHARGRRYFLQQSQDDKDNPLWMAEAARKMLSDQGATVKIAPYHGQGAYNFATDRWDHLSEAIAWLESGKLAKK